MWNHKTSLALLNTSTNFIEPDDKKYFDLLPNIEEKYSIKKTEKYNVAGFNFIPDDELYDEIDSYNEAFYNEYQEEKLKAKGRAKNELKPVG